MSMPLLLTIGLGIMVIAMALLWVIQLRTKNAGTVDVAWSAGIGALALLFAALADGHPARRWLVGGLTAVWSLRLAYYLIRRVGGEQEDGRYQALRESYGPRANRFFFWFFQFQALLVVLFALPPLLAMTAPVGPLRAWDFIGVLICTIAIAGETLADRQLATWRANPANQRRTCRSGLWRYSRHPNYFFEWLHWWAYCAFAAGTWAGLVALLGPALMLLFLFKVTGIPPTEARALARRGDDYRDYQRTTSVFFPWFPKEVGR